MSQTPRLTGSHEVLIIRAGSVRADEPTLEFPLQSEPGSSRDVVWTLEDEAQLPALAVEERGRR